MPPSSHNTLPLAGSYDTTRELPWQTTSVRFLFFHTSGVAQPVRSLRATFHSCLPVFLSRASRNDLSSLSDWMYSRWSSRAGELPLPCPIDMWKTPTSLLQSFL